MEAQITIRTMSCLSTIRLVIGLSPFELTDGRICIMLVKCGDLVLAALATSTGRTGMAT